MSGSDNSALFTAYVFSTEVLPAAVALYGAYWALSIRRALTSAVYRRQALLLGLVCVLIASSAFVTNSSNTLVYEAIVTYYAAFVLIIFAFIDSTIPVARRSDPLLRDILHWRSLRVVVWAVEAFLILLYYYLSISDKFSTTSVDPLVVNYLFLLVPAVAGTPALLLGALRSRDQALRSHLKWLGLMLLLFFISAAIAALAGVSSASGVSSSSSPSYSLVAVISDILYVLAFYALYRSARALAPMNRLVAVQSAAGFVGRLGSRPGPNTVLAIIAIIAVSSVAGAAVVYSIGPTNSSSGVSSTSTSSLHSTTTTTLASQTSPSPSQTCVASSGYIYCIDGSSSYFAALTSSGIGPWKQTTSYPTNASQTCVATASDIFCFDGNSGEVHYAPISSSGVGQWKPTTSYPAAIILGPSCVAASAYIYCLGGNSTVSGTPGSDLVYYATASTSGIGPWQLTLNYSVAVLYGPGPFVSPGGVGPACMTSSGFVYCTSGAFCYPTIGGPGCIYTANSYFAMMSSSGVEGPAGANSSGSWGSTTPYPIPPSYVQQQVNPSCAVASGVVYCVGGGGEGVLPNLNSTYYAPLSGSGIGNWTASTAYPVSVYHASCVTSSGYLYCVNGVGPDGLTDGTAYFARITSEGIGEWAATDDFP
jgi:hypothetical protein